MRRYAMCYSENSNHWSIIFRDDSDPKDVWWTMQDEIQKQEVAETIVDALNASSH